ncbi:hypothetical protein [Gluconobacter oxydans]|uniref:hypothetical protein n=1 Tax=Gluconobacter oxydans TaxID=442 RepID=UPI000BF1AD69|nr:hypothetical protein [Gluconobacter oxydans]
MAGTSDHVNNNPEWVALYPARYYVSYDHSDTEPAPPTGWYDMALYQSLDGFPMASDMVGLTADQWDGPRFGVGIANGHIVPYTPPMPVISLKEQASHALSLARSYIYSNYGILNEPTPDSWVTYLKALMAIQNGTDTTSTSLPAGPKS